MTLFLTRSNCNGKSLCIRSTKGCIQGLATSSRPREASQVTLKSAIPHGSSEVRETPMAGTQLPVYRCLKQAPASHPAPKASLPVTEVTGSVSLKRCLK